MAYAARKGQRLRVVVDGHPQGWYDGAGEVRFSPGGERVAFLAQRGNMWSVVIDGEEGVGYASIGQGTPVFSPNGKRLAYAANDGREWCMVVDGREGPKHEMVLGPTTSVTDAAVHYLAIRHALTLVRVAQRFGE